MKRVAFFLVALLVGVLGSCSLGLLSSGYTGNGPGSNPGGSSGGTTDPPQTYNLELEIIRTGSGTELDFGSVARNPHKDQYTSGEFITFTATPGSGYFFSHWGGDGNYRIDNPLSYTIGQDTSLTAVFSPEVWNQVSGVSWSGLSEPAIVQFDNKLWILGGGSNNIWSSVNNGTTWNQVTLTDNDWSPRSAHGAVVFNNKIWVIGGAGHKDVWSSEDGTNWQIEVSTNDAPWGNLGGHGTLVFNNKIWILGGAGRNDVWSSSNGTIWTQVTANPGWSPRTGFTSLVYDGKMWVIGGGQTGSGLLNDVWSSEDGETWTKVTDNAPWSPRWHHGAAVIDGRMWILGGWSGTQGQPLRRDIWSSTNDTNELTWIAEDHGSWQPRSKHRILAVGNRLWMVGGEGASMTTLNDLWYREFP